MTHNPRPLPDTPAPTDRRPVQWWLYAVTQWRRLFGLNLSRINDLLYVGGEFRAAQWPTLHRMGVRAVLSLQAERADTFTGPPPERTLRLHVPDFYPPSIEQLHEGVAFIREAQAASLPVLVHCHAGVGRAPLTASAFLVSQGMSAHAAVTRIRQGRPIIAMNERQLARLAEWEALMRDSPPANRNT